MLMLTLIEGLIGHLSQFLLFSIDPFLLPKTSSAVDCGFEPQSGQTKTKKLVFVSSPQSMQHKGERLVDSESG